MAAVRSDHGETAVRPMAGEDIDEVIAIERRAYPFPWTEGIFRDCIRVGYSCWVFCVDNTIRGYGVLSAGAGEAHLLNISVDPDFQGAGLGRRILIHFIDVARRLHADTILLEVRPSNKAALRLYERLGFHEVGIRRDYYPDVSGREDALILARAV